MLVALSNPFDDRSFGARICDSYAFPTAVYHLRGTQVITSPTNNTAGSIILAAHPIYSYVDLSAGTFSSATFTGTASSMTAYSTNAAIYGASTPTVLAQQMTGYRVVSAGFKIRVQIPELNRTGRLMIAPIAFGDNIPGFNNLNAVSVLGSSSIAARLCGGVSPSIANTANILDLPGAFEVSFPNLATQDIMLIPKPMSPAYLSFHTSSKGTDENLSSNVDDQIADVAGVITTRDNADLLNLASFTGFIVHWEGIPTASTPLFDIEYVYHLEGSPQISSNNTATPVPSGNIKKEYNTETFNKAMEMASKLPWHRMINAGLDNLGIMGRGGYQRGRLQ